MTVTLHLAPGSSFFDDPLTQVNPGVRHVSGLIPVMSLPEHLPDDPNARVANLRARNAAAIRDSLLLNDGKFHLKSKGITLLASDAVRVGPDSYALTLAPEVDGVVDGGHTYSVIQSERAAGSALDCQLVPVNVRVACAPEDLAVICEGLNTSVQVSATGLMARAGLHSWLQDEMQAAGVPAQVAWRENAPGDVTIEYLIRIVATVSPGAFPAGHPVMAYTSTGVLLERYREFHSAFVALSPIVCDVLRLHDRLSTDLAVEFRRAGADNRVLFSGQVFPQQLFDEQVQAGVERVPTAVSLAATAGLRAWVVQNVNGAYVFDRPVAQVYEETRALYGGIAHETIQALARNGGDLHRLGCDHQYWADVFGLFARSRRAPAPSRRFADDSAELSQYRHGLVEALEAARQGAGQLDGYGLTPRQQVDAARRERVMVGAQEVLDAVNAGTFGVCLSCQGDVEAHRLGRWASALRCRRCALAVR